MQTVFLVILMKVLFVSHACSEPINRAFVDKISGVQGMQVMLLTTPWWTNGRQSPPDAKYELVVGRTAFGPHIFRFFFFPPLFGRIMKFRPDIINLDEEPSSVVALQAVLWKWITGAKLVFKSCENIYRHGRFPLPLIEKIVLANSDYAIALNNEVKEVLERKGFRKKIKVIGLGLDEGDFRAFDAAQLRKDLGLGAYTIGYMGRLVREKGVETMIEACAKLDFEFNMLIDDWSSESEYREELLELAEKNGIKKNMAFVSPSHEEAYKYFNCIDLLVVPSKTTPSWKEQFGKVVIEAMIIGKPVLVSDSGNLPSLVVGSEQVFSEGNATELAGKIKLFRNNRNLVEELAEKGKRKVLENFTWKKIADKTVGVYNEMVGK